MDFSNKYSIDNNPDDLNFDFCHSTHSTLDPAFILPGLATVCKWDSFSDLMESDQLKQLHLLLIYY